MADVRPFCALRPCKELASKIAALPYDVYNREEAKEEVQREPMSFLCIDRPETWFDTSVDTYDERVYKKAREVLLEWKDRGYFVQEEKPCYYVYEQVMDGRSQAGIVGCVSVNDYLDGIVKKHENTRTSKEVDRITHIQSCQAQTGPIFLAYRCRDELTNIMKKAMMNKPLYDFVSPSGIAQKVWCIDRDLDICAITNAFKNISDIYIADGHHRAASAVKTSLDRRIAKGQSEHMPCHDESDYFLSVLFPDSNLKILPYHRILRDLNHYTENSFIEALKVDFEVEKADDQMVDAPMFPPEKGTFGFFVNDQWYLLRAKEHLKSADAVDRLDVAVLEKTVLNPLIGISDVRVDQRIDFVGGNHSVRQLEEICRKRQFQAAFAMYPTSMEELFAVADEHRLMPPKSTWFEPKLLSGLFIHEI